MFTQSANSRGIAFSGWDARVSSKSYFRASLSGWLMDKKLKF